LERFRALRVLTVAAVPFIAVVLLWLGPFERGVNAAVFLLLALACLLGPDAALDRATAERQYAIRVTLPDFIDLLTFSVEAGLGVDQALERAAAVVPGPLAEEVNRMVAEVRAGAGRADALRSFERRIGATEVRSFALALIQADTYGAPVGMVLRAQGEELRVKRSQLAQERAQKAPVKLLIPTVFCVMPALFVVVVGPAMIDYLRSAAGP
ncbi:MAG: type II secretion system F family protein, partial [Acidimicrobiales bacterium]